MRRCRFCGCTDGHACVGEFGNCQWVLDDVCSFCVEHDAIADFVLHSRLAHWMAGKLGSYSPEEHETVAVIYALCAEAA